MSSPIIRAAYSKWPYWNRQLRNTVAALTDEQVLLKPGVPDAWPIWAIVGHAACQRVFWLCDFAGEPGAETTPFTNAGCNCPGDDDLENVLSGAELADALESTFAIVERCLESWTVDSLGDVLKRPEWDETWVHTRGSVIQRLYSHDVYHIAEVNQALGAAGLPLVDLWAWSDTE
jgi:hypothetical protein